MKKIQKRNRKPIAAPPKSPLRELFEKWVAPVILTLIIAAASYTFVDRVSKLESTVADLQKTLTELDTSYSKDSESKGTLESNVAQIQQDVATIKGELEILKQHVK